MVEEYELDRAEGPEAAGGPLFMACMKNHVETASYLLEARAHPDKAYEVPGTTPLAIVAKEGHMEALRLLLRAGADLNLPTPTGVTPLVAASAYGQHDAVVFLLENLAEIHKPAGNGMSALLGACTVACAWSTDSSSSEPTSIRRCVMRGRHRFGWPAVLAALAS